MCIHNVHVQQGLYIKAAENARSGHTPHVLVIVKGFRAARRGMGNGTVGQFLVLVSVLLAVRCLSEGGSKVG